MNFLPLLGLGGLMLGGWLFLRREGASSSSPLMLPGSDPREQLRRWLATNPSAEALESYANQIATHYPQLAAELRTLAETKRRAGSSSSASSTAPPVPPGSGVDSQTVSEVSQIVNSASSAPSSSSASRPNSGVERIRSLATRVANEFRRKKRKYSHNLLRDFQRAAGIKVDGLYGGQTRGALEYYGAQNLPRPYYRPYETVPYRPSGS